jgi:hypothetical protein
MEGFLIEEVKATISAEEIERFTLRLEVLIFGFDGYHALQRVSIKEAATPPTRTPATCGTTQGKECQRRLRRAR